MAMAFTFSVLENGSRDLVLQIVGVDTATTTAWTQDGTQAGILANGASYTPTTSLKLRRVIYNTSNCAVRFQWHQTSNAELVNVSGYGVMDLRNMYQGMINPKGAGSSGDIDIFTYPTSAVTAGANIVTAMFSVVLEFVKGV